MTLWCLLWMSLLVWTAAPCRPPPPPPPPLACWPAWSRSLSGTCPPTPRQCLEKTSTSPEAAEAIHSASLQPFMGNHSWRWIELRMGNRTRLRGNAEKVSWRGTEFYFVGLCKTRPAVSCCLKCAKRNRCSKSNFTKASMKLEGPIGL